MPDDRRRVHVVRRGGRAVVARGRFPGRLRSIPGRQGGDPVGQRPDRLQLRLRHQPSRRRVVPDQPAKRGRGEPGAARPLRLRRPDLPVLVRSPGVVDQGRPAQTDHLDLSRPPARMGVQVGGLPGPRHLCYSGRARRGDHTGRRRRHDRRHRRHHWSPQRGDADRRQPRDDDRADPDRLPLRGSPDLSRARAADPRRRRALLPGPRPRRRGRDHARPRRRRVPRTCWRSTRSRTRSCRRP